MDLTPEVIAVCRRSAASKWRSAHRLSQTVFDFDDLFQQALIYAWQSEDEPLNHLYRRLHYRLIDYMRAVNPKRENVRVESLDDIELNPYERIGYVIELGFLEIEEALTRDWIFSDDLGDPRGRTVAWLHANDVPLREIGAHLGISEGRACQVEQRWLERARRRYEGSLAAAA